MTNTIQELSPISCLIDESTFLNPPQDSNIDAYMVQYIRKDDGTYLMRRRVAGGRVIVLPVQKVPGVAATASVTSINTAEIKARKKMMEVNTDILPSGKIPSVLLYQIVDFFTSVMNNKISDVVKGQKHMTANSYRHEYEAMAHIIWNRNTKQYRVGIPTQRVSKASVSYDHDDYSAADGDVVVVDIHSHNTMGEYYSFVL